MHQNKRYRYVYATREADEQSVQIQSLIRYFLFTPKRFMRLLKITSAWLLLACVYVIVCISILAYMATSVINSSLNIPKNRRTAFSKDQNRFDVRVNPYLNNSERVLLITDQIRQKENADSLIKTLDSSMFEYDQLLPDNITTLSSIERNYKAVVINKLSTYMAFSFQQVRHLHNYLRLHDIGLITFASNETTPKQRIQILHFPLYIHGGLTINDYQLNINSEIPRISKAGEVLEESLPGPWTVFVPDNDTYIPLSYSKATTDGNDVSTSVNLPSHITAVQDSGRYDGIRRVFFGQETSFWYHRMLFLDALTYVSGGGFALPLQRFMVVDIDDVFHGDAAGKMTVDDVDELLRVQALVEQYVPGFRFNLGFCGNAFEKGIQQEVLANKYLVQKRDKFWWFDHTWSHIDCNTYGEAEITTSLRKNEEFAKEHDIETRHYIVAPFHRGVFPIHKALYSAFNKFDVTVTSTVAVQRGFIYNDVMVLPRKTFHLFTHHKFMNKLTDIIKEIKGGATFDNIIFNPIIVFMTHFCNFGKDRLALHTVEAAVKFVTKWTNLELYSEHPTTVAKRYFEIYPEYREPLWTDPCVLRSVFLSDSTVCQRMPGVIIAGPAETGSNFLQHLFELHPNMVTSSKAEDNLFFTRNYLKYSNWYFRQFPEVTDESYTIYDTSFGYFWDIEAPRRIKSLLPHAKVILMLAASTELARECYDRKRRSDVTARKYSFRDILMSTNSTKKAELRRKCLLKGLLGRRLALWMDIFTSEQLFVGTNSEILSSPFQLMARLQKFLQTEAVVDYTTKIKFNQHVRGYCDVTHKSSDHSRRSSNMDAVNSKCYSYFVNSPESMIDPDTYSLLRQYYKAVDHGLYPLLDQLNLKHKL